MGNNYYIDETEGEASPEIIDTLPHIGKYTFNRFGKSFIFYISRAFQIDRLQQMNLNQTVIDEFGEKKTRSENKN